MTSPAIKYNQMLQDAYELGRDAGRQEIKQSVEMAL